MSKPPKSFVLPDQYSPSRDSALVDFLLVNAGSPVEIIATGLGRIDGPLVELLLIAVRKWQADRVDFTFVDPPPRVGSYLRRLGVEIEDLNRKVAT